MTVGDYRQMTDKVLESSRSSIISHGSSKAVFYPSPPPFVSASATDAVQSASDGDRNHVTLSADNNNTTTKVLSATAEDDDDQHQLVYADLAPDSQPKIQQLKDVQQLQEEDVKYVEIEKA